MPRRKPQGWPKLMVPRRLATGAIAYYWVAPTWAVKAGYSLRSEALGRDYADAKRRCDEILNPRFDEWRTKGETSGLAAKVRTGTFDWMVGLYRSSPKFTSLPEKTRKSYDASLALVGRHPLKDGRHFGDLALASITPGAADRLHAKIKVRADGTQRVRSANLAMSVCKRAWTVAHRHEPKLVPAENPFAKMDLEYTPTPTRPVSYGELLRFVEASDEAGEGSIGTAAMIAFFWLQRQVDIISRLSWSHYRPADAPNAVKVFHHKTGALVTVPLTDDDGTALWPEITARLDSAPRHGTLIVTRETPDRRRKAHLPWKEDYFRKRVAAIREAAGVPVEAKFMGLRHGGNVEGAEADLTDAQLRALSGHKTTAALLRYAQATDKQRVAGARKRLAARTKAGDLSK
jgi:hypothetical protein